VEQFLNWFMGLAVALLPGLEAQPPSWNGYVEADYVYIAAPVPGVLDEVAVREGDMVAAGDLLFVVESAGQRATVRVAEARVAAAAANAENLATGSREAEIEVIRASLAKAQADLELAQATLARSEQLTAEGVAPKARLDQDRAAQRSALAQVRQLEAELLVAELPARGPLQLQAEANVLAAEAEAEKARADLDERSVTALAAGRVERVYFVPGEMAAAGTPVVALLPPRALKVRFFVSEADRPRFVLGDSVAVSCDGCPEGLTASLSFFAAEPQFTPPVIYSREERSRLSFLAEAILDEGAVLPPGQPVTVAWPE
jgi:HlyD family secretion protein